jgi:glycosyltransferase involved in cell wall biosynthesis
MCSSKERDRAPHSGEKSLATSTSRVIERTGGLGLKCSRERRSSTLEATLEDRQESMPEPTIAVLIPCYNEAQTVASVVEGFQTSLPDAEIVVVDNNSSDATAEIASASGARVLSVKEPGKGNAVRRAFADVDADIYVMVDGDNTYDSAVAPKMTALVADNAVDLVNAIRLMPGGNHPRRAHAFGNKLLTSTVKWIFDVQTLDMLSGYKAMSRRFVKSMPVFSTGFEIETEIAVHSFDLHASLEEVPANYIERPEGSDSKLSTFKDGFRIFKTIVNLARHGRPLFFYSIIALACVIVALILGIPIIVNYANTGLVPKFPTAILATGLVLLGAMSLIAGLILDAVTKARKEVKALQYLAIPPCSSRR